MAIQANKLTQEPYIPVSEQDDPYPATFHIQPVDGEDYIRVMADFNQKDNTLTAEALIRAARAGIKGWENVADPDTGSPLEFSVENMKYIPGYILVDVGSKVVRISQLTEAERKNS